MSIIDLLTLCAQSGIRLELDADGTSLRFRAPKGSMTEALRAQIAQQKAELIALLRARDPASAKAPVTPDPARRHEPFPLTDIQEAYVIGRESSDGLGGPCLVYAEFSSRALDVARLERAWQRMIERHDVLRSVVRADLQQQILRPEERAPYRIQVADLRALAEDERAARLLDTRTWLTEITRPLGGEPLFDVRVSLLPDESRLHFALELLLADAASIGTLFADWKRFYEDPERAAPPLTLSFRDYVLAEQAARSGPQWQRSVSYWESRAPELPPGPELPRCREPGSLPMPRIRRMVDHLSQEEWQRFQAAAATTGLTPSMALCAAWAEILARWSHNDRFLLNLTTFRRLPLHAEVDALIGDFTSTLLLERDGVGATFRERAQRLSEQFARDLEHAEVSGVQVQRLRRREGEGAAQALAPLVFTSLLGHRQGDAQDPFGWGFLGELSYLASRTPQVWIDHQVFERQGRLQLSWDVAEELFPAGLIDDLFGAYLGLLRDLAASERAWQSEAPVALPAEQTAQRAACNATAGPLPEEPLFAGFLRHAARHPDDPAILTAETALSYAEVELRSRALAQRLIARGAAAERLVAIVMPKGWEQVVAALSVVRAGAAYLPVDPDLPPERIALLLRSGAVQLVVTTPAIDSALQWPDAVERLQVDAAQPSPAAEPALPEVAPSRLAYVIFTSGSTGQPKGVMIEHRAAVNTIADINERFGVRRGDRTLALSSLSFDLSVYDVFGTLAAGGAIVLPGAADLRDPTVWAPLMRRTGVTVWNSVPALLEMLVDYAGGRAGIVPETLRVVMLSGDWIPVTLPDRLRALVPSAQVFSLGGATEASIWSISYPIEQASPDWRSVPYGRPLRNQRFAVLDAQLRDRPVWVDGELFIAGDGLARGYFGDAERTRERFPVHPRSGERLYRTGDLGRYLPDGNIEFLGRADTQIKLRGFRIELGEIEAALSQHPAVAACAVVPEGPPRAPSHLEAYVVPRVEDASGDAPEQPLPELAAAVERELASAPLAGGQSEQTTAIINGLIDKLVVSYTASALLQIGAFGRAGVPWTEAALMELGLLPRLRKWLRRALELLTEAGMLEPQAGAWVALAPLEPEPVEPLWQELLATPNELRAEIGLIQRSGENMAAILTGAVQAVEVLFPGGADADAQRLYQSNIFAESNRACRAIVAALAASGEPIRALEIGAGVGSTTQHLLPVLPADRASYVYTDISRYFLSLGKEQFAAFPYLRYQLLDAERDPREQGLLAGAFNLVVASSALHATRDIRETLEHARTAMCGGGVLLLIEETRFLPLHNLTMGLQQGFDRAEDAALRPRHPLLTLAQWEDLLTDVGFTEVASIVPRDPWAVLLGVVVIVARLPRHGALGALDEADVLAHLAARLPAYMVPTAVWPLQALPLSANGKVDRAALSQRRAAARKAAGPARERLAPSTALERELCGCFGVVLGVAEVGARDSFFALGGDSLLAAKLCARVREQLGADLSVRALFAHPTVAELAAHLESAPAAASTAPLPQLVRHPEARWEPFPLTEVQQAYWLGRNAAFDLGNVATHAYFEIEPGPQSDLAHIEAAWQALIERHDMLRATVRSDGSQVVAPETPPYRIAAADLRALPPAEAEAALLRTREEMAHQVLDPQQWPLFCIRGSLLPGGALRLHLSFDMLIVDASSLLLLIQEWAALLAGQALPPLELSFRDYVLAERDLANHPLYLDARDYWLRRLQSLPAAPELPLRCQPQEIAKPRFVRQSHRLGPAHWQLLRQRALAAELTPSAVLLCAYAETLARFSRSARFTLNLTLFQRLPLHPQVDQIVGDFTSVLLLEVEAAQPRSFRARAQALQGQLAEALDHRYYGGVSLLRELARLAEDGARAAAPVVFTSALPLQRRARGAQQQGSAAGSSLGLLGKLVHSLAQTSQVWLDLQVLEDEGALTLTWDAVEGLFAPALLDEMFAAYVAAVRALADSDAAWLKLPGPSPAPGRGAAAPTARPMLKPRSRAQVEYVAPRDELEAALARFWADVLTIERVGVHDNFLAIGGDSLLAARLLAQIRAGLGHDISLRMLFRRPTVSELAARLRSLEPTDALPELPLLVPDPAERGATFPLTDVQQAYWLGRRSSFELGGVATHLYLELALATWVTPAQVEASWQRLIDHHDMLRAVIRADGQQQILPEVPRYRVAVAMLAEATEAEINAHLERTREELCHQVLDPEAWPLFCLRLTVLPERRLRVHLSIDMLIADSFSLIILMRQWATLLRDPSAALPEIALTFRDYVVATNELQQGAVLERSRAYWLQRLGSLPEAPPLPLRSDPAELRAPRFERRQARLPRELWRSLQQKTAAAGLSPSVVLMAAYADALAEWCGVPNFTLNLTLFQRLPLHPQVDQLVGDFTSLTLLEVDVAQGASFRERARRVQEQLWEDLDHRFFSGVKVMRELTRRKTNRHPTRMPVVFTSALPLSRQAGVEALEELMGEVVYSQAQSSQVWLDHQVMEDGGELVLIWDVVKELFDPVAMDAVFERYTQAVRELSESEDAWLKPPPQTQARALRSTARVAVAPVYVAPQTPTESSLAALWEQVLGGGPYGAEDDFLLAGGDSLLGARLISIIERDFGVTVSMTELHEERSLSALALVIEERVLEGVLAVQANGAAGAASAGIA